MEYIQTKDDDFGLPVNCMLRAYRKGINNTLSIALNIEKHDDDMTSCCANIKSSSFRLL